jgi:hypothetical protein
MTFETFTAGYDDDKVLHGRPWAAANSSGNASQVPFEKKHDCHYQNHDEEEAGADHKFSKT